MRRILILQTGTTAPAVRKRFGDYPAWFARHLGLHAEVDVADAVQGKLPPDGRFHAFLVTGSSASITAPEPWMDALAEFVLEAARTRPVLGVCFGHQLIARALGGKVEKNPQGREVGTTEVTLTGVGKNDPLFEGLPSTFAIQQTHEDHVTALPAEAVLLAENAQSPVQAYGVGATIRCVQFHPEMDAARSRALAESRHERLEGSVPGGAAAVLASIRHTPHGEEILLNWLTRFVGAVR